MKLLALAVFSVIAFSACQKEKTVDPNLQLGIDSLLIKDFITKNGITGVKQLGRSGLYYQIIEPGSGTGTYRSATIITVNYTGRYLSGGIFDKTTTEPRKFELGGGLITGWQAGIPLIRKGGKIRLFIPSLYGYGPRGKDAIPPNAVLDFDIELVDVQY